MPGADLALDRPARRRVQGDIILHSASAPTTWTFPLDLQGVTPSMDASGRVLFTGRQRDHGGLVPARVHDRFQYRAQSGHRRSLRGATYALQRTASGGWAVQMSLDTQWLDDPARYSR